jgi:hypothetical protein
MADGMFSMLGPRCAQEEADGNDDGNNGNQSRPQARSGNHPRADNPSGPGQVSHLKSGQSRNDDEAA